MKVNLKVRQFLVVNINTGKEFSFGRLDSAENYILQARDERPSSEWKLYAEIAF